MSLGVIDANGGKNFNNYVSNTNSNNLVKENSKLPTKSEPNTSLDLKEKDRSIKQRRFYGPDDRATKDIDYKHQDDGTHEFPHEHQWNWDNGVPTRSK